MTMRPDSRSRSTRRLSRLLGVQALYQWLITQQPLGEIEAFVVTESEEGQDADMDYFKDCFLGAVAHAESLRASVVKVMDRPLAELSPVEHAILLLSVYELSHHPEVPYRVVINEAIELAKSLGGNEGHRYINGVLDRLAPELRPHG
jgi:N utilization substance protein B